MRKETFLYADEEQTLQLLGQMYTLPSARGIRDCLANRQMDEQEKHFKLSAFVKDFLVKIQLQHSIQLQLNEEEIEGLITYLLAREDLDLTFFNEVYRVYNESLKCKTVQTSKFPRIAAFLWDTKAFVTIAVGQFRESAS